MLAMVVSSYPDTEYIPEKYTNMSTFFPLTPMGLWGLICCLRTSKTFIFHGFTHTSNFIGVLAALFSLGQIPVICTITGMGRAFSYGGVAGSIIRNSIRLLYFFAQFFVRVIIVQNKDDYLEVRRLLISPSRCIVLKTAGSGIPTDYFRGVKPKSSLNSKKITVGFFSRALPQKGVWSFFELAAAHLASDHLQFIQVGLPGVGELGVESISLVAERNNVSYLGHASDLRPWLLATDVVVIPSDYREGVSRLLIESMLAGKVVIAKKTTGVSDHLEDGVNGFVYASDSDLLSVFERALSALSSPIPENAKRYAEKYFDVALVNKVYFAAYRRCGMDI